MFNPRRPKTLTVEVGKARRSLATSRCSSARFVPGRSVRGRPAPVRSAVILPHRSEGGNLSAEPVCGSGARAGACVLFLRAPQSSGIGSAAVGKKMEGRKMGTSSESGGSHPTVVSPTDGRADPRITNPEGTIRGSALPNRQKPRRHRGRGKSCWTGLGKPCGGGIHRVSRIVKNAVQHSLGHRLATHPLEEVAGRHPDRPGVVGA